MLLPTYRKRVEKRVAMNAVKRNCSIDIFRYVCAVLVVIIHTEPFYRGEYAAIGIFLKDYVARIAVPFFLTVSGYYYFHRIDSKGAVWKYVWRLVKTYAIWSLPYFLINFWALKDEAGAIVKFFLKCVLDFFFFGSPFHFWFFPALIYSILIVTFLYKKIGFKALSIISALLFIVGCLGSSYLKIGLEIPILADLFQFEYFAAVRRIFLTGIPFVCLGGWLSVNKAKFENTTNKKLGTALVITVLLYAAEKTAVTLLSWQDNLVNTIVLIPLVAIIVLLLLKNPAPEKEAISRKAKNCANFMYYMHVACILFLKQTLGSFFEGTFYGLILFVLVVIIMTITGMLFSRIKIANKLLG